MKVIKMKEGFRSKDATHALLKEVNIGDFFMINGMYCLKIESKDFPEYVSSYIDLASGLKYYTGSEAKVIPLDVEITCSTKGE